MSVVPVALTTAVTALVLTLPLFLSVTFRDAFLIHMKRLYVTSGEVRLNLWNRLLDVVGDDPEFLWGFGSWFVLVATYWIVGSVYTFFDLTNKPAVLRKYKVQPGTNEPVTYRNLFKIMSVVLFNQFVITIPVAQALGRIMLWRGTPPVRELPPFHEMVIQIVGFVIIEEFGFYYSHRLLHHKRLYKYIHKKHHEWTAPMSIVALYSNPLEHLMSNIMPAFLGVFLFNSHVATAWLWFGLAIAFTLSEHSGYHLPFFPSSEAHDFHHLKFTNCYGVIGLLDWFHGTDVEFRKTMAYPRHRILLGLTSARKLYPDSRGTKTVRQKLN